MGEDLLVTVEGGKSHIGTLVLAQPYEKDGQVHATLSAINRLSHKDDVIASMYARAICEKTGRVTACAAGMHYDDYSSQKLEDIMAWVQADLEKTIKEIQEEASR